MRVEIVLVAVFFLFVLAMPAMAQQDSDFAARLTEENIRTFLEETKAVSLGQRDDLDAADIRAYLEHHMAEKGSFNSKTKFEIPGYPAQEAEMKLDKAGYIANVLEGQNLISDYQTEIEIKSIRIAGTGKSATISTVSTDSGAMPWPDSSGEQKLVPIKGSSTCEQTVIISLTNYIQMADAECTTLISFVPFGDKPLGE